VAHPHGELLREQLVELDAAPGGVAPLLQIGLRNLRRRTVQEAHRVAE
jgi:hypothetical protein